MNSALLEPPTVATPGQGPVPVSEPARDPAPETGPGITVHGDFNCPWSYLAFRRTAVLAAAGVHVDWRAVEHAPWTPATRDDRGARFEAVRGEMDQVLAMLLPGEQLPYDFAGFWPRTRASVTAYAEAYASGRAEPVRRLLFESFWMHGIDIGDARVLRTLVTDELRGSRSGSEIVSEWGYPVDVTGGAVSSDAWRLVGRWSREWRDAERPLIPMVQAAGERPMFGRDAVEWLGHEIVLHGLEPDLLPASAPEPTESRDLPGLGWVSEQGGQWLRRYRRHATDPRRAG